MRICYVRHADHIDDKITKLGKKQIKLVVDQLAEENLQTIYCSPALRCLETAKLIADKLNLKIVIKSGLDERFKIQEVKNEEEKQANLNYLNYKFKTENKDIETCKDYIDRNFKVFEEIVGTHKSNDENILIVAHSSTLYALNAYICGLPKDGYIKWMRSGNCSKICYEK